VVIEGTGIIMNNEMDDFVSAPGSPNQFGLLGGEANKIEPFKRPLSSMTPTLVLQRFNSLLLRLDHQEDQLLLLRSFSSS
jgi:gamma-glutamyltranspeptidase/glutathione hydrolase